MSMRISSTALALALAACGSGNGNSTVAMQQRVGADTDADRAERIPCARGSAALATDCTVERAQGAGGLILTLRHPDGAFHRLLVTKDGRGVVAADGAEAAEVTIVGTGGIDVALGGDRYRLPATVGKHAS